MAVKEWNAASGAKWATNTKWTPEGQPEAGDVALFTAAHAGECKVEKAAECQALRMGAFTGAMKGAAFEIKIGNSETEGKGENIAFEAPSAGALTGSQTLNFVSTFTTVAQKILCKGKTIPWKVTFSKAGRWQLAETLRFEAQFMPEAGTFEGNGQLIEGNATGVSFFSAGTANVDLSGCTLRLAGSSLGWNWSSSGILTTTTETLFEIGNAEHNGQFGGGGQAYHGTVKLIGRECHVDSELGQTLETLELANKGTSEAGIQVKQGSTTTFTTLTTNGTEAERARIESNEPAKAWKLKHEGDYEPANSFLAIKDCTFEGGVLYLPHGEDLGGNTNIKIEEKPSEGIKGKASGAILLGGTATATLRSVIKGAASGALLLTGTSKGSVAGAVKGKASGALTLAGTASGTLRALVTGKASGAILLTGTATGQRISKVTGKSTGTLLLTGTSKGTVATSVTGKASGVLLLTGHAKPVSLVHPPGSPGVSSPQQSTGSSSPSQLIGVTSA